MGNRRWEIQKNNIDDKDYNNYNDKINITFNTKDQSYFFF